MPKLTTPGKTSVTDVKKRWSLENEIEWTENYIRCLERALGFQDDRLNKLYLERAWWERFIRYCNTPTW
jgi:uncharacterized protein YecT (DUF1311 family)